MVIHIFRNLLTTMPTLWINGVLAGFVGLGLFVWGAGLMLPVPFLALKAHQWACAGTESVLTNPVAYGAWLYKAHCVRCHGDYGDERLASDFEDDRELQGAFEHGGCRVKWGRRHGGKLGNRESNSLVKFMRVWEENEGPPDLPELPPLPTREASPVPKTKAKKKYVLIEAVNEMDPTLKELLDHNPVAHGAWLYTQNCYRCHLTYDKARSGRGFSEETVRKTITNGKTTTQMTPFSRMLGGKLSNTEISHIVSYIMSFEKFGETPALAEMVTEPPEADPMALLPIGLPRFPRVVGNADSGARLYARNCVRCHGTGGEGHIGRSLAKPWKVLRPDLMVKSLLKQGVPGTSMPSWSQNNGGNLSAKEIDDLVGLVMSWIPG